MAMIPFAGVSTVQPGPLGWAGVPWFSAPPGLNGRGSKLRGSSAAAAPPSARRPVASTESAGPALPVGCALISAPWTGALRAP